MAGNTVSVPSAEITRIFMFRVELEQPGAGGGMLGGGASRPRGRLGRCGKSTGPVHRGGRQTCASASAGPRTIRTAATATNLPTLFMTLSLQGRAGQLALMLGYDFPPVLEMRFQAAGENWVIT